jgi:hypothetical protein
VVTLVAEVHAKGFLAFSIEIVERLVAIIITKRAGQSVHSPLISAAGAEKIPFPSLLLHQV